MFILEKVLTVEPVENILRQNSTFFISQIPKNKILQTL